MIVKRGKIFLLLFFVSVSICGIAQNNFNAGVTAKEIIGHYTINNYSVDTVLIKIIMEKLTREQTEQVIEAINLLKEENQQFKTDIISLLKEIMSEKPTIDMTVSSKFNPKSLIPSWVQFERGDKCKAHLFLWSEVVFIPSAIVSWPQYCKYKKLSEIPSRNQNVYETNRDIWLGLGVGTTALAVGFYVWNIIDGNTNKTDKFCFMPYVCPNGVGVLFSWNF